jgi:hypothetical protein
MGKVFHASYSGYFPTCIVDGTPTPPEQYLKLTLEQGMALFWRVKIWEAKATGSFYDGDLEQTIEYISDLFEEMIPSVELTQEEDLICKGNELFYFQREALVLVDGVEETSNINFRYSFSSIKKDDSNYYPYFLVSSVNSLSSGYTSKIGTYKITYLDIDLVGDIFGNDGSFGNVLIEINAKEYWPYAGTYDTATGNRL